MITPPSLGTLQLYPTLTQCIDHEVCWNAFGNSKLLPNSGSAAAACKTPQTACRGYVADTFGHTVLLSRRYAECLAFTMFNDDTKVPATNQQHYFNVRCQNLQQWRHVTCQYLCIKFHNRHAVLNHVPAICNQQLWLVYARGDR